MQFYWWCEAEPVKRIFLFLWNSPNVYTLVWKHTNKWRNICTFQILKIWHLRPSNPQLISPTLQIQYCYSLIKKSSHKAVPNHYYLDHMIFFLCLYFVYLLQSKL
jgi:hypothetical protein